jgi:xylose dehydrogenase (NAD/NADP)
MKVAWGVLGVAQVARNRVMPAIRRSRNGYLVAVASRDLERAQLAAREFGAAKGYGSYEELIRDPQVTAVYVPLPNNLHREWTIRAAEAGKHVLCEKPLAMTAAEAEEMVAACAQHSVVLMEAFMYRFHPRTQEAIRLVQEGAVGTVRLVRASFSSRLASPGNIRLQAELGGGALLDSACYGVNACRMILGEPVEVSAEATFTPTGVVESVVGTLRFPDGAFGLVDASMVMAAQRSYEVVGTEGLLTMRYTARPGWGTPSIQVRSDREIRLPRLPLGNHYVLMVEAFADAILRGTRVVLRPEDSVANMRVLDALRDAILRGRTPCASPIYLSGAEMLGRKEGIVQRFAETEE